LISERAVHGSIPWTAGLDEAMHNLRSELIEPTEYYCPHTAENFLKLCDSMIASNMLGRFRFGCRHRPQESAVLRLAELSRQKPLSERWGASVWTASTSSSATKPAMSNSP